MISKADIKKLAELSRIHLTEKEEKKLADDLQSILGYMEKLKEVDISGVPEMTHALETKNVFRDDEPAESRGIQAGPPQFEDLGGQFPEEERGYLKVKGVFERD